MRADSAVEERPFQGRVPNAARVGLQTQWRQGLKPRCFKPDNVALKAPLFQGAAWVIAQNENLLHREAYTV